MSISLYHCNHVNDVISIFFITATAYSSTLALGYSVCSDRGTPIGRGSLRQSCINFSDTDSDSEINTTSVTQ